MDLSVKRDTVRINEPVFDNTADHPVESDVLLPDYCPDIARILKTEACAMVDTKTLETDRLVVAGNLCVKIIYVPDNSCAIRCFSYESAFAHTFEISGASHEDMARVKVKVDYVNCRPIGPRRMQIKASVSINAKVWSRRDEEFISDCEDDKVELLSRPMKVSSMIGACERPFKVEEELEVGYGKPAIASIIRSDATATVQDFKVISNKIIAKGELMLHTLYSPDISDAKLEVMDHSIPISQILDLEGVDEESICTVSFFVTNVKVEASADGDGENRMMMVDITLNAQASARRMQDFTAVADAYSPVFEMGIQTKQVALEHISDVIRTSESVRLSVEAPGDGISAVTDCTVRVESAIAKAEGKNLMISGEMMVSAMGADMQGGPVCIEKPVPFKITEQLSTACENMRCDPDVNVVASSFSLAPSGIDVRVDCAVTALVFVVNNENLVSDISLDESRPRECRKKTLTLYFADKGECLWDIAKRYSTSMDAIRRENNLETDCLPERSMLLIPKKHCSRGC
jgi:hypothetical protein